MCDSAALARGVSVGRIAIGPGEGILSDDTGLRGARMVECWLDPLLLAAIAMNACGEGEGASYVEEQKKMMRKRKEKGGRVTILVMLLSRDGCREESRFGQEDSGRRERVKREAALEFFSLSPSI
jgi:hypothetical protein